MYCEKYVEPTCHGGEVKLLAKIGKYSCQNKETLIGHGIIY